MNMSLKAETRGALTKAELNGMRTGGKIPAVVYGKKVNSTPILVDQKQLIDVLRVNPHAIIELDIPSSGKQPVMINGIHRDKLTRKMLHIDFHQINMDEPVKSTVLLDFVGDAAGSKAGGIFQAIRTEIEIFCLPSQIPSSIEVDVNGLDIGDTLLVSDLKVPAGVQIKTDMQDVLATVLLPQKEAPSTEEAAEESRKERQAEETAAEEAAEPVS
jgi:large subunit ribosomal protein L25